MIDALPATLRPAVSPFVGIVGGVEEVLAGTSDPRLFRATCELAAGDAVLGTGLGHVSGIGGAGLTRAHAAAAAVGEALERYSASFVPWERIVVASARALGRPAVEPERFALFSRRQFAEDAFPFRPFDRDTVVPWIDGIELATGAEVLLPAELALLGSAAIPGEQPIGYATSSGAACAESFTGACVRGLFELLERDAFMLVWANRLSLPCLDWTLDAELRELDERFFRPTGLAYAAVDLSCVHDVPSVLGIVRSPAGTPGAFGVGAGTAATLTAAWWKALSEAFAARSAGAKLELMGGPPLGPWGRGVVTFEDHIRYYADRARAEGAGFLTRSEESVQSAEAPPLEGQTDDDLLDTLCARVAAAGSTAYAVDVTAPDVRELGLVVVKTLAPELCALDVPHAARFLGGSRLYDAAAALGLSERPLLESELNLEPHPFP